MTANSGETADRPLPPGNLLASIFRVLRIDHELQLPDRQGRPVSLLEQGSPIAELF